VFHGSDRPNTAPIGYALGHTATESTTMRLRTAAVTALVAVVVAAVASLAIVRGDDAPDCPVVLSHRGLTAFDGPAGNSVAAYVAAWDLGVTWIESDVRFTSDDVPVIMHDETVDHTTDGTGKVQKMTAAEFTALHLADGQHPPTLAEVVALTSPERRIVLEIKRWLTPTQEKLLLAQIQGKEDRLRISGFDYVAGNLERLKAADPELHASLITTVPAPAPPWSDGQHIELTPTLTAAPIDDLHRAHVEVTLWLPDNVAGWDRARDLGADAITTNKATAYLRWVSDGCT
jgi:glycerophosphoryl diester phosphodiesterase